MNFCTRILLVFFCLLNCIQAIAQKNEFTISGTIKDASNGEYLTGALFAIPEISKGRNADVYGFYSLTIPKGEYKITFSMLGYKTQERQISLVENVSIDVALEPVTIESNVVEIEAGRGDNTKSTDMGKIGLEIDQVKKLPVLLGEIDILKTITLLPGVKSSGEGNAGFYVRGGGVDQNLILLDNATVYNASHLFGFFSVFNADAVKDLELTKGGIPAHYGTRLASVLDISLKEGNQRSYHVKGGIGTVASRFTVEGPIKKDTSSFIISGRRTYIDALVKPLIKPTSNFAGSGYYFYDLNVKINYRLGKKDQLFASGYFGRDVFTFASKQTAFSTKIPWGNETATLRWNHQHGPRLTMNAIATYTRYNFSFQGAQEQFEFRLSSGIRDYGGKLMWSFFPGYRNRIRWGVEYTHHDFMPNSVYARSGDTEFDTGEEVHLLSHEQAVYLEDDFDINENIRVHGGIRYSFFAHVGPFKRYKYPENSFTASTPVITEYAKNELVKFYGGWEPRLNVRYSINKQSSIKAGYMRNYQYIHLTSLSPTSLPTDVWLPSTDLLPPQLGQQISAGYFRDMQNGMWESSAEIYYKTMDNQTEYKPGSQPDQTINDNIDNLLLFGTGESYGLELFLKKAKGNLNGWVGYTLARTYRTFAELNDGKPFPARWDRRHDVSFVLNYKISEGWDFGFVFVYSTGSAITLPESRYFYENRVVDVYGARNSFRMAPYHRADLSFTYHPRKCRIQSDGKKPRFQSNWNFSVYNLYNRRNPYFIYFGNSGDIASGTLQLKAYQVSLFPILPSVTWNFEF